MAICGVNVNDYTLRSLSIYVVESGLLCFEIDLSPFGDNIWKHKFVGNNHIVTFSSLKSKNKEQSNDSKSKEWHVKLWDIFAGVPIQERTITCEDPDALLVIHDDGRIGEDPDALLVGQIVYLEDGVPNSIPLFVDPIYDETTDEEIPPVDKLVDVSAYREADGAYGISIPDRDSLTLDHWMRPPSNDVRDLWTLSKDVKGLKKNVPCMRAILLDQHIEQKEQRFLIVTAHSVHVYWINSLPDDRFWKPQYIHIFPEARDHKWEITYAAIRRQKDAKDDSPCQLIYKYNNSEEIRTLEIPGNSTDVTPRIAYDCIQSIDVFNDMAKHDMFIINNSTVMFVCCKLLEQFLKARPTVFNRPVLRSAGSRDPLYKSALSILIRSSKQKFEDLIQSIIETETYIPNFEDFPKNTISALSVAIDYQRTDITKALLKYFRAQTKTEKGPLIGWMTTVVNAMDKLQNFSPDFLQECMRDITYVPATYATTTRPNLLITKLFPEAAGPTTKMHLDAIAPKGMTLRSTNIITKKRGKRLGSTNLGSTPVKEKANIGPTVAKEKDNNSLSRLCIAPLPGFMTYTKPSGDKWWDGFIALYVRPRSPFSTAALRGAVEVRVI